MQIEKNKVVSIHYTLTDNAGKVIDSSDGRDPLLYIQGIGNIIPGLEEALEGKSKADKLDVTVSPDKGYGNRDERMVQSIPRSNIDGIEDIQIGMQLQAQSPDGQMSLLTVTKVEDETVTVDGNHPLAGETLNFAVEIVDIRDATKDELAHGHAHAEH